MNVLVDGRPFSFNTNMIRTMGELVEYVKTTIDPDSFITDIHFAGEPLKDADWRVPLSVHGDSTLEITTAEKAEFIESRLAQSSELLAHVINSFQSVREQFDYGNQAEGNKVLGTAVKDLAAFLDWYNAVLVAAEDSHQDTRQRFLIQVEKVSKICEQLVQQQLYHSWWAVGETIEQDLIPQLGAMKDDCIQ